MTDIVTRLRASAPYSDDGEAMREAADIIEQLRAKLEPPKRKKVLIESDFDTPDGWSRPWM